MLSSSQKKLYAKLNTPVKIQNFLDTIKMNFEKTGETCRSPKKVLETNQAHCMEGAMLAASILRFHKSKPLVMDLRAAPEDDDHVVTLFKQKGLWGAISKTNHAALRYREPVYRTLRELALSYFHEYFDNKTGKKNLREYSLPMNLSRFDNIHWEICDENLWEVPEALDKIKHFWLFPKKQISLFRNADPMEIRAGKLVEWE